jgi:membrane-associated phospholipid phosphatase
MKHVLRFFLPLWLLSFFWIFGQSQNLDQRLLHQIYEHDSGAFKSVMQASDKMAYPLFVAVPAAEWLAALTQNGMSKREASTLSVAMIGTAGSAFILKKVFSRNRPFVSESGISCYRGDATCPVQSDVSLPSGHAALAFALATSLSIQRPKWYVIIPSYLIASSIGLSRIWNGVHYPSDVLAGAALGTTAAIVTHRLMKHVPKNRFLDQRSLSFSPNSISFQMQF